MSDEKTENFLAHYGVRGMKWGVKKGVVNPRMQRTNKENKIRSERKDVRRKRQTLSDKQLESYVKRLEAEKKLKTLLDDDLTPGKSAVQMVMRNSGTKVAGAVAAGAGMYVVRGLLTKNWGLGELASNIPKFKK